VKNKVEKSTIYGVILNDRIAVRQRRATVFATVRERLLQQNQRVMDLGNSGSQCWKIQFLIVSFVNLKSF
jgi:hypothetical protein